MIIGKDLFWYEKRVAELEALRLKDTERLKTLGEKVLALEQQNLALLAAIEAVQIDAEECLDFDECTAMLVPIDTYHALIEPAADLLAKRDQRRDAALLRKLSETFRKKENWGIDPVHYLLRLASERESGEWVPELEVK